MEVYHGAHTMLSSMAEGNGDGAFLFVLLHNVATIIFFFPDQLPAIKNIMHAKHLLRFCSVKFHFHWNISGWTVQFYS